MKLAVRNFNALAAVLATSACLSLSAAAQQTHFEFRELSGEELLAIVQEQGGHASIIERDPETGVITSMQASGRSICEYDYDEMSEVLESLQAAALTPKKPLGDLAQTSVKASVSFTGTLTSSSATVSDVSSFDQLAPGMTVTGTGIAASTTIQSIDLADQTITLSQAATAAGTNTLTASGQAQVIGLSEWTIDWKRKTVDTTTTDDAEYEGAQGSTKSWTAKAKYMFIDSEVSQADNILAAIDSLQLDAQTWNFFPTVETGRAAFQGDAIIDGITLTSGMGKVVGMDVSLKGTGPLKRLAQAAPVNNLNTVTGLSAQV